MSAREKHLPNLNQFEQTAVENVRVGGNFTIETITQNISQIVIKETGDRPPKVIEIDWREVCSQVLTHQQENQRLRRKATELGFELNVYVPLGLVERKQQQRRSASDDVEREDVYQLSEEVITKEYKHDAFLNEVIGVNSTDNKHVAIVGEPGAGKTTLLTKIADWIDKNEKGLPICISLANLQKKSLEKYLLEDWLKEVLALDCIDSEARHYKEAVKESLKERFCAGGVWLLLDGLDEMAVSSSSSALAEIQRELSGWVAQARIALTSRLNVWDFSLNNPLANFETYRTLEFSQEQVKQFIKGWFAAANNELLGTQLQEKLKESQNQRVRELVKNPLRLALLCQSWYKKQRDLPGGTRAGLYQRFVQDFYQEWKSELHTITWTEQQELNKALGKLALAGIEIQTRFRLGEKLAFQVMGEQLFKSACDWGWLNLVDRDADTNAPVYAFFHPSFQEYFAATAIDDWHFFLNHIPNNPIQGTYRIFEPQWKEVILLWLGREYKAKEEKEKEKFINALVKFEDGCSPVKSKYIDRGFYEYRAYCLAAAGINEFKKCSRTSEIVKQVVQWASGKLILKKIKSLAKTTLTETNRVEGIAVLLDLIASTTDEYTRKSAAEILGKIGVGNEKAIASLVKLIASTTDESTCRQAAESLGRIGVGNEKAIATLVQLIASTTDESTSKSAAESLERIGVGNEKAIASLVKLIASTTDESTCRQAAEILGRIGVGNEKAIATLVQLIDSSADESTCRQAAEILGKIGVGNEKAIVSLVKLIASTTDESTCRQAAESLERIGVGDEKAIASLVKLIDSSADESTRKSAAEILGKIGVGNEKAIASLVKLI
ncbi:MAG: HEAT repeat domain-containing protein, partial [Xenococcaceae cyanobacterium MO_234.B1]|nr:HEAT repeat domain-containing protein [Xenococcaceae cyanobacterium MO_234.B1]